MKSTAARHGQVLRSRRPGQPTTPASRVPATPRSRAPTPSCGRPRNDRRPSRPPMALPRPTTNGWRQTKMDTWRRTSEPRAMMMFVPRTLTPLNLFRQVICVSTDAASNGDYLVTGICLFVCLFYFFCISSLFIYSFIYLFIDSFIRNASMSRIARLSLDIDRNTNTEVRTHLTLHVVAT